MVYGVTAHVPAPVELYDKIHGALLERTGTDVDGLLLHLGHATPEGFDVVEVWESREHYDRYNRELVGPLVVRLLEADAPSTSFAQQPDELEVRGLVIPRGGISL